MVGFNKDISYRCCLFCLFLLSRVPTLSAWGGVAAIAVVYFADWKVVLTRIPFVRGRFPPVEAQPAPSSTEDED